MRMRWSVDTLLSNRWDRMKSKEWRLLLKRSVKLSSSSWLLRKNNVVLKRNSRRTLETNCTFKRKKRPPLPKSVLISLERTPFVKNCRLLRSSRLVLRLSVLLKKLDLRTNSRISCMLNSLRMSALSRWMPRRDACANKITSVKSSASGKIDSRSIKSSVKSRSKKESPRRTKSLDRCLLFRWKKSVFWPSMLPSCSSTTLKLLLCTTLKTKCDYFTYAYSFKAVSVSL